MKNNKSGIPITDLQKINYIFEKLRDLEDQKLDLSAMAVRLANQQGDVRLIMTNPVPFKEPEQHPQELAMNDFMSQFGLKPRIISVFDPVYHPSAKPKSVQNSSGLIDEDIPDTLALQIIGLLTAHKNAQIKALVDQLVEMGFER